MAKKKETPEAEGEMTAEQALAFFVNQEWYTNPKGLQQQSFAVPQEVLEAMRKLVSFLKS